MTAHNAALLAAPDDHEAAADALTQLLAGQGGAGVRVRTALEPALGNLALVLLGAGELGRAEALLAENRALVGSARLPQVRSCLCSLTQATQTPEPGTAMTALSAQVCPGASRLAWLLRRNMPV